MMPSLRGHNSIVEYLIKQGAKVNVANQNGDTPLDKTTVSSKAEVVALLKQAGATYSSPIKAAAAIGADIPLSQLNANLRVAAHNGDTEKVERLLKRGANIEARDDNGQTALIHAARNGNTEIVGLLLKRGADTEAENDHGQTALMIATDLGEKEIADLLREFGAEQKSSPN